MKVKILKSFNLAFALSTWILALAMDFFFLASLSVKTPLFKKGGMLRETLLGKMSWIRKPLSPKPYPLEQDGSTDLTVVLWLYQKWTQGTIC